jgi:hypothetical protein
VLRYRRAKRARAALMGTMVYRWVREHIRIIVLTSVAFVEILQTIVRA